MKCQVRVPPGNKVREGRALIGISREGFTEEVSPGLGFEDWVGF